MNVILGGNDFFGVPFPLVLGDRFFHMYPDGKSFKLDVFRWDDKEKTATYEVRQSQPIETAIATNPTGIVTFSREADGAFLFKFRPKPGVSQIFGHVPVAVGFDARVTDHELSVVRGDTPVVTLKRNQFTGFAIGVQVFVDGGVAIASNALPEGMAISRK